MNPWLETLLVALITTAAVHAGIRLSKLEKPYWIAGYFLSVCLISLLIATRLSNKLAFAPILYHITAGRLKFVVLALAVPIGLMAPLSRVPRKAERITIGILMMIVIAWFAIFPFLAPALIHQQLTTLKTITDARGNCYQSLDYTCGPAAAVTALNKLNLPASEGQIAILAHSSPVTGTLPASLAKALNENYGYYGLKCHYRSFDSVNQLINAPITLAVIRDSFLSDHCVTILKVTDKKVRFADPVFGLIEMPCQQFEQIWRFSGIVLEMS